MARDEHSTGRIHALSVDVEDYYHAHALEHFFTRDTWPDLERRVEHNTMRLLDLFDEHGAKGTFFTLGSVAREYPGLISEIVGRGHELASHGMDHVRASDQDQGTFLEDVRRSKAILEDRGGVQVNGYRAASFSIGPGNWWAFDCLEEAGFCYSSSLSIRGSIANHPMVEPGPFCPGTGKLVEVPVTTFRLLGRAVPTGGGYFRLMPGDLMRALLRRGASEGNGSANFYIHPWEIDPDQPKASVGPLTRFRHRANLAKTYKRLDRLLEEFRWAPLTEVFPRALDARAAA